MAVFSGPEIVNNGLVLHLDAANQRSYSGSGTTWSDLSGNGNNGTLVNGVGYSSNDKGTLTFDGINDEVQVPNSTSLNPLNNTLICWVKSNTATWNATGPLMSKRSVFVMYPDVNTRNVRYFYYLNNSWQFQMITASDITIWNMYACTWNGTAITAFLNGNQINSGNKTGPMSTTDTNILYIGRDLGSYLNGNIAQSMMYNRALTAEEIKQNFEALRGRYNV
jgi:hypothetical protein